MRRIALILSVLLVLLMAAAVALPFLVPVGAIVAEVEREVEAKTGRALSIAGRVDLSYYPSIAVTADDVRFAGIRQGEDLLHVKRMAVRLRLMPLLRGRAEVEKFVLTEPFIDLTVDKQGKPNWDVKFIGGDTKPAAASAPVAAPAGKTALTADLSLAAVDIVDGRLRYTDARNGLVREATDLDMSLSMPDLDSALRLEAAMKLDKVPVTLDLGLAPVRPLLFGGTSAMDLRVEGGGATAKVKGGVERKADEPLALSGDLALTVSSMADLLRDVTGAAVGDLPFDDLSLTGRLTGTPARIGLAGLQAKAGDLSATGDLTIRLDGARPALGGALSLPHLALDAYLPASPAAPAATSAPASAPATTAVGPAGWSKETIDLSALKVMDLDLTLKLAGVTAKGVEAGPTTLGLKLVDGRLQANLADTTLFGGTLGGRLSVDANRPALNVGLVATAKGVQAEPLLTQFAGFTRLSGSTDGSVDLHASGSNQQELVGSLDGKGDVIFRDGAVKGINLAQLIRNAIGQGVDAAPQTDFAEMGGTFTLVDGLASTEDFHLLAPLLRVTGKGTVNLPSRRVDMRLSPKLVASLEGQGTARADADGITVPVRVRGTFDDLSFTPDLSAAAKAALKDPAKAKEQLDKLKSKDGAKSLLNGLLGTKKP